MLRDRILAKAPELAKAKTEGDEAFMEAYNFVFEAAFNEDPPKTAAGLIDYSRYWPDYWTSYWKHYPDVYFACGEAVAA